MRKLYQITTESGSLYLASEETQESDGTITLSVNQEGKKDNDFRWRGQEWDSWQPCTIAPWPPVVGEVMMMVRPLVPYGQGRLTRTSRVIEVKVGEA